MLYVIWPYEQFRNTNEPPSNAEVVKTSDIDQYIWEIQQEEASDHYSGEGEWEDFVESFSTGYSYVEYDKDKHYHLAGYPRKEHDIYKHKQKVRRANKRIKLAIDFVEKRELELIEANKLLMEAINDYNSIKNETMD